MKMRMKGFTLIELLIVVAIIAILAAIAVPNFLEAQVRAKVSRVKADQRTYATGIESYQVDWNEYPCTFCIDTQAAAHMTGFTQFASANIWIPPLEEELNPLTTPVSYLSTIFAEPFNGRVGSLLYSGWDVLHNNGNAPADQITRKTLYLYIALPTDALIAGFRVLILNYVQSIDPTINGSDIDATISKRFFVVSPGPDTFFSYDRAYGQTQDILTSVIAEVTDAGVDKFAGIYDPTNGTVSRGEVVRTAAGISTGGGR